MSLGEQFKLRLDVKVTEALPVTGILPSVKSIYSFVPQVCVCGHWRNLFTSTIAVCTQHALQPPLQFRAHDVDHPNSVTAQPQNSK